MKDHRPPCTREAGWRVGVDAQQMRDDAVEIAAGSNSLSLIVLKSVIQSAQVGANSFCYISEYALPLHHYRKPRHGCQSTFCSRVRRCDGHPSSS